MLFARYRKMAACPSNTPEVYAAALDAGHAPLQGLNLNVTCFAPTLIQVGWVDTSNNFTPFFTSGVTSPALGVPQTWALSYPTLNLTDDTTQQLGVSVTNLDSSDRDVYLDMTGTES